MPCNVIHLLFTAQAYPPVMWLLIVMTGIAFVCESNLYHQVAYITLTTSLSVVE